MVARLKLKGIDGRAPPGVFALYVHSLLAETEKKRQDAEKLSALLTATRDAFVKAAVDEAVKSQAEASAGKAQAREASLRAEAAEALRKQV